MKKRLIAAAASIVIPAQADLLSIETHLLPEQEFSCSETAASKSVSPTFYGSAALETPNNLRFGLGANNTFIRCDELDQATMSVGYFAFVGAHKTWFSGQGFALSSSAEMQILLPGYQANDTDPNATFGWFPQIDPVRIAFDLSDWQLRLSLLKVPEFAPGIHFGFKF